MASQCSFICLIVFDHGNLTQKHNWVVTMHNACCMKISAHRLVRTVFTMFTMTVTTVHSRCTWWKPSRIYPLILITIHKNSQVEVEMFFGCPLIVRWISYPFHISCISYVKRKSWDISSKLLRKLLPYQTLTWFIDLIFTWILGFFLISVNCWFRVIILLVIWLTWWILFGWVTRFRKLIKFCK